MVAVSSVANAGEVGYTINSDTQDLYQIDLLTGTTQWIGHTGRDDIDGLAAQSAYGPLFGSDNDADQLFSIDQNSGHTTLVGSFNGYTDSVSDTGLAFSPGGTLYLVDDDESDGDLYTVNTSTAQLTYIGSIGRDIDAIAFNSSGVLYAFDDTNNRVITVNHLTAAVINDGLDSVQFNPDDEQGMSFDSNDTLYLVNEDTDSLYRINTTNGQETLVASGLGLDPEALTIAEAPVVSSVPALSGPLGIALLLMGVTMLAWRRLA